MSEKDFKPDESFDKKPTDADEGREAFRIVEVLFMTHFEEPFFNGDQADAPRVT